MHPIAVFAEHLILNNLLKNEDLPFISKGSKTGTTLMAIGAFLLTVASVFLIYAAYLWLGNNFPPDEAAAITGALVLGVAALFFLTSFGIWYYRRYRLLRARKDMTALFHQAIEFLDEELSKPVQENPKTATALASLAGFTVGEKVLRL